MSNFYDKTDPVSIEKYAKKMIGKTFREIWEENEMSSSGLLKEKTTTDGYMQSHTNKHYKGGMGNLVEECYFKYKSNNDSNPDFKEAGVELKVTPYKKVGKKQELRAKERLIITMIDYYNLVKEPSFWESHVWKKAQLILLVWYLYEKGKENIDFHVDFVKLFTPPDEDRKIMEADYNKIVAKVRAGKAHELSEGDTLYLGAATKGATSADRRKQPYSDIEAKQRAFSFKNSYMTYVLNTYFVPDVTTYEPIVHGEVDDFEGYVVKRINAYRGKSVAELCQIFDIDISQKKPKNLESMLAFRMLGVKGNHAEEFEKAGIVVKTIRIEKSGSIQQSMSFPVIDYQKLVEETWDDCTFGNYLRETRFFFVIYKKDDEGILHLSGSQFWNIPEEDLEGDVRSVWQETHDIIKNGQLEIHVDAKGNICNNLPKQKNHTVSHVRPHGRDRNDTHPLPVGTHLLMDRKTRAYWIDDTRYVKQCFWLNNTYIIKQIKAENK